MGRGNETPAYAAILVVVNKDRDIDGRMDLDGSSRLATDQPCAASTRYTTDMMDLLDRFATKLEMDSLDDMSFSDLEIIKSHIETVRRRILALQNSQSPLLRLPGELRNRVFLFAMHMELQERRRHSRHATLYTQPSFFAISRQLYAECRGLWINDVLVWEEYTPDNQVWRRLPVEEIWTICKERSKTGRPKLVTQPAHCDLSRTRRSVEDSRSICPRKGLVRVQGQDVMLPQMKWWVW